MFWYSINDCSFNKNYYNNLSQLCSVWNTGCISIYAEPEFLDSKKGGIYE
jgi:hypothetical protein